MPQAATNSKRRDNYKLSVNAYDRASSLLVSLIVMVAVAVFGMLIVFFARRLNVVQTAIPVTAIDPGERSLDAAEGLKEDIEPPGLEEAPELDEPALQDTLNALANAVSTRQAVLSDEAIDSNNQASKGKGLGDSRQAGTGNGVPLREPRREVRFEPASLDEYARFLDSYGIEIALWGRDKNIYYVSKVSTATPETRVGSWKDERRLSMEPKGVTLRLSRQLARRAGISDKGPEILQYYPPETEGILLGFEKQAAGGKSVEELQFTAFRVNRDGGRFTFSVEEQK